MKKSLLKQAALASMALSMVLVSGCGGGGRSKSTAAASATQAAPAAAETVAYDDNRYEMDQIYAESGGGLTGSANSITESPKLSMGRKLIRDVNMEVETDAFDTLLGHINKKITELGGYTEQSRTSGRRTNYRNEPQPRYASITARIPADKLDSFVTAVEENGNVVDKSETTKDVTLQYSDLESKKKSLTVEQERIWALLEKADTLEAVISLEQRLSDIRYELESMESQLRLFDNQVEYSTVTISIQEVTFYTPTAPVTASERMQTGFSNTVKDVSGFFTNLCIGLVSLSPIWLPMAVIGALVFFFIRRRHKKGKGEWKAPKKPSSSGGSDSGDLTGMPK